MFLLVEDLALQLVNNAVSVEYNKAQHNKTDEVRLHIFDHSPEYFSRAWSYILTSSFKVH